MQNVEALTFSLSPAIHCPTHMRTRVVEVVTNHRCFNPLYTELTLPHYKLEESNFNFR